MGSEPGETTGLPNHLRRHDAEYLLVSVLEVHRHRDIEVIRIDELALDVEGPVELLDVNLERPIEIHVFIEVGLRPVERQRRRGRRGRRELRLARVGGLVAFRLDGDGGDGDRAVGLEVEFGLRLLTGVFRRFGRTVELVVGTVERPN